MDHYNTKRQRKRFVAVTRQKLKNPVPTIAMYTGRIKRRLIITITLSGLIAGGFCLLLLGTNDILPYSSPITWIFTLSVALITSAAGIFVALGVAVPLYTLLRALARVSGEPINGPIPNPNDVHHVKSGLSTAIQTVYSLDGSKHSKTNTETTDVATEKAQIIADSVNRMHGAIVTLDSSHAIIYASRLAPTHSVGNTLQLQLLFHGDDTLDRWLDDCRETAVKAERQWQRIPDTTSDIEGQRFFDIYASYEKGAAHETVLTFVDMTDRYQEDEENLNFIAFAAHELRGPITVIRGYLDVLEDELNDMLAADQHELFHRLNVSASRLSSYINNILNTSRYDRRHLSVSLEPATFNDVYAVIGDDMALRARSQNRLLSVSIPADLPQIAADIASLSEVVSNLVDNAIKYSNEGGAITVSAKQNGDFVDLSVEDNGIGMSTNILKNLFQKFYRSHRSRETVAGSGIGLYISKAIVESHGGTIRVQSTEGKGSRFTISIPTYASVADKLAVNNTNQGLISQGKGWIKNHSMYRG